MSGRGRGEAETPAVLLVDAGVLIDYRESDLNILKLVAQHVGRVAVVPFVLDEVGGITATDCARLGIKVIEVETEQMHRAAEVESSISFIERLCLVVCREEGWTCVTNDSTLRRLCKRHGVETRFGLGVMVELVAAGVLNRRRAMAVARSIQTSNPLHVNAHMLADFRDALDNRGR